MKQTDWVISGLRGAAARLGVPRTTLIYKMRKLGIEVRRTLRLRSVQHETPLFARAAPGGLGNERFERVVAF